jgi:hypothetical protein
LITFFYGNGIGTIANSWATLEDIVRRHPDERELAKEFSQDLWIIVHSPDKRGLIEYQGPGPHQKIASFYGLLGELSRVIEMGHDIDSLFGSGIFFDHLQKFGIVDDPLREVSRNLTTEADDLYVGDLSQPGDHLLEAIGGKHEGVSPGEDDVGDLLVQLNVAKGFVEVFEYFGASPI